jgi:hypothetical protein
MMTGGLRQLWKTERRRGIFEALGTGCRVPGAGYWVLDYWYSFSTGKRAPGNEHLATSSGKRATLKFNNLYGN